MAKTTTKATAAELQATDGAADYEITELAPPRIAGRRIAEGQTDIRLTEEEARAELLAGHIRPKGMPRRQRKADEPQQGTAALNAD
ncbi:hypothetical protein DEM27_32675 [Metarhizobium album]|uniref:Uncharacterized protein n=1 Tax=Metarhizobium album TaxID=2182425 RepID=A0A2U2DFQ5_9HYPH|nr:hypothetical protein [Rhizobium album]PWE52156.1 hypothetical protein DEM27_32675 [Rhizobium album]